jgi:hypothetical protein
MTAGGIHKKPLVIEAALIETPKTGFGKGSRKFARKIFLRLNR